jgi:hypothetical protein
MEKTRITHVRDGLDFLGFHLQLGISQRGKFVPKIKVPRKALTQAVFSLNEALRWRPLQESAAARIVRGSAVVLGWSNYYKIAHDFRRAANWLDHHAYWIAAKALCRKFDLSTAQCLRKYGIGNCISLHGILSLRRAQDVQTAWYPQAPKPYRPGTGCYLEDVDWEVEFRMYDQRRPGSMDFKVFALFRDGNRCRQCGTRVTYEDSQADHIKPISSFAGYEQAHFLENIQTLCLACHKEKSRRE